MFQCQTDAFEVFHCIFSLKIMVESEVLPLVKSLIGHVQDHLRTPRRQTNEMNDMQHPPGTLGHSLHTPKIATSKPRAALGASYSDPALSCATKKEAWN